MTEPPMLRILIESRRKAAAGRWAEMLRGSDTEVWVDPAAMPQGGRADVVVTDDRAIETPLFGWNDAAVVEIGSDEGGTDNSGRPGVALPDDVTGRELRLVCRLAGQIVALNRQQRREARLRDRLAEEASTDPLTGLPNRRAWDAVLAERLESLRGPTAPPCPARRCVAIVDLDHFKPINDTHGHAIGDDVLRIAGGALRDGLRPADFVARLGGDEFALLLTVPDAATARTVIDRVRHRIPAALGAAGRPMVTASAGFRVAAATGEGREQPATPEKIMAAADAALREAKGKGRDRTMDT